MRAVIELCLPKILRLVTLFSLIQLIMKKTKKSEKEVDIRPFIYHMEEKEGHIYLTLAAGSSNNTKPELVMEAFCQFLGVPYDEWAFMVHRSELYADTGTEEERHLVPLEALGEEIE